MDLLAVRSAAEAAVRAMLDTDPMEHRFARGFGWPGGSCEDVSAVVAAVLEDRGLGQWVFVTADRSDGEFGSHAWLEWRDELDKTLFSVDATIQQFPQWSEPFIGAGMSPAASIFHVRKWEGIVWNWPDFGHDRMPLPRLIAAVRQMLNQS